MNRYDLRFLATCPVDGRRITYALTVEALFVIAAEDIVAACSFPSPVLHEDAADALLAKLGGRQMLVAVHGGVRITTTRGSM
jgi:hypothetical protein